MDNLAEKYVVEDHYDQSISKIKSVEKQIKEFSVILEKVKTMREDF